MKKNRYAFFSNQTGFSLSETMVVIAIIAIMAAIGIPTFSKMIPDIRLRSAAQDLYSNLQATKMDAIKENSTRSITFDPDNGTYTLADGTIINLENEYSGSVIYENPDGGAKVTFAGAPPEVTFSARGMANFGTVFFKNTKGKYCKVEVLLSGLIQIKKL